MRLYAGSRQILFSFSTRRIYFQGIFHHRRSFFCGYGAHVRRLYIVRQCIRPFRSSRINLLPFFQCPFCQFFQKDPIRIFIIDGTPLILQLITDRFHAKLHLLTCSRIKTLKICKILELIMSLGRYGNRQITLRHITELSGNASHVILTYRFSRYPLHSRISCTISQYRSHDVLSFQIILFL